MLTLPRLSFTRWSKNQAKQLPHHSNCPRLARDALVFGPSALLNRDPTPVTSVNNTSETVPQPSVSQQSTTSQRPHLESMSGQLQEQGFFVELAERIAAPQRSSTRTIYKSKWALLVESLIRVMYWVVAAILNRPFKPLNIKILHNICTHICTLRCIVYNQPFWFIKVYFIKLKPCLALHLGFCKVPYVLETIVFSIVLAYSSE